MRRVPLVPPKRGERPAPALLDAARVVRVLHSLWKFHSRCSIPSSREQRAPLRRARSVNTEELDPAARIIVRSYLDTSDDGVRFKERYGLPFSVAQRSQHMRTIAQAYFLAHERYQLGTEYTEFGRVQFDDLDTGQKYLLKSARGVTVEAARQLRLWQSAEFQDSDVTLAIYRFNDEGLFLSVAKARRVPNRKQLVTLATPMEVGLWSFADSFGEPFDQRHADPFEELGDVDLDAERGEDG